MCTGKMLNVCNMLGQRGPLEQQEELIELANLCRRTAADLLQMSRSVIGTPGIIEQKTTRERVFNTTLHVTRVFKELIEGLILV